MGGKIKAEVARVSVWERGGGGRGAVGVIRHFAEGPGLGGRGIPEGGGELELGEGRKRGAAGGRRIVGGRYRGSS